MNFGHCDNQELIIQSLRERVLDKNEKNGQLFHELDVRRVRTDDWQIQRFVITHQNEDKAFEALVRALQWKNSFGIHDRNDHYFPIEFYENFQTHSYGRDKEDRLILWIKNRNERNIPELNLLTKQFFAHIYEKTDSAEGRYGITAINDTNCAGFTNINMEIFKFKVEIQNYYPDAMKLNLVVDLPTIMRGLAKVVVSLCDQKVKERFHFIKREELVNYLNPGLIPAELGGNGVSNIVIPEGLQTMKQLSSKLGLSDKIIKTYYKSFDKIY